MAPDDEVAALTLSWAIDGGLYEEEMVIRNGQAWPVAHENDVEDILHPACMKDTGMLTWDVPLVTGHKLKLGEKINFH